MFKFIKKMFEVEVNSLLNYVLSGAKPKHESMTEFNFLKKTGLDASGFFTEEGDFGFGVYHWKTNYEGRNYASPQVRIRIDIKTNEIIHIVQKNSRVDIELFKNTAFYVKEKMIEYKKRVFDDLEVSMNALKELSGEYIHIPSEKETISLGKDDWYGGMVFRDMFRHSLKYKTKSGTLKLSCTKLDEYPTVNILIETHYRTIGRLFYNMETKKFEKVETSWNEIYDKFNDVIENFLKLFVESDEFLKLKSNKDSLKERLNQVKNEYTSS